MRRGILARDMKARVYVTPGGGKSFTSGGEVKSSRLEPIGLACSVSASNND